MANPQHLEWLHEGVEAWNARRKREDFIPDFELLDFNAVFAAQGGREGSRIELAGYNLRNANLRGAKLVTANLRNADLLSANLQSANLFGADLGRANLRGAIVTTVNSGSGKHDLGEPAYTDLSGVRILTQEQLDTMVGDTGVILPQDLHHPAHWPDPELPTETVDLETAEAGLTLAGSDVTITQQDPPRPAVKGTFTSLVVAVRSRSTAEIRQSLMANYGDASSLAKYMVDQIQREIAAHLMTPVPNEVEKCSEYNARLNFLRETLVVVESLNARIPAGSIPELSEQDAKDLKEKLIALADRLQVAIRYLDSHTGTYGNLWKLGMIGMGTSLLGLFGIPANPGALVAAGVVGASTFRVIFSK